MSAARPPVIVCLGDSITGSEDRARFLKWPTLLGLMIEAVHGPGGVTMINAGIAGDTTAGMRARLERDVLAHRPDIVVVLAGGNDAGTGVPRSDTAANLDAIAKAITAAGARLLALQYHLLVDPAAPAAAWRHLPTNNDLLAAAARAVGGVVVDTAAAMDEACRSVPAGTLVGSDAVHLLPGGEVVYARAVAAAMREAGWIGFARA